MALITIGIFAENMAGLSGAVLRAVNHGLISARSSSSQVRSSAGPRPATSTGWRGSRVADLLWRPC